MGNILMELGNEYENDNIKKAGILFAESGKCFEKTCDIFIDYLLDKRNSINISSGIFLQIADIEYRAYELISKGINEI